MRGIIVKAAARIKDGYNASLAQGCKTRDLGGTLGTAAFADAVIARLVLVCIPGHTPLCPAVVCHWPPRAAPASNTVTSKPDSRIERSPL